ncbi:caspase family protein [Streptomyces sp. NPDC005931]|uniref:caspase family protein n=1 Tax=Streptomyces sp. NPDC005931 TaxID=3364737 RepID=UPI0036994DD1
MSRLDPRGLQNRALLVGVSEYDLTEPPHGVPGDLPAVKHNLNRLREVLPRGRVFAEHEITVAPSPSLDDFGRALRRVSDEAEGLLLLYFAGHGAIPSAGDELFLQMRNASVVAGGHAVFPGAETFTTVLTVLAAGPARRVVVILDCCFAGNAAWIWETFREKRRVLLLMGVQANHRIDAGDPRTPTPYTAELVRLLDEEGETGLLDLSTRLRGRMADLGLWTVRGEPWVPQHRAETDEDVLLAAKAPRLRAARYGDHGVPVGLAGPWGGPEHTGQSRTDGAGSAEGTGSRGPHGGTGTGGHEPGSAGGPGHSRDSDGGIGGRGDAGGDAGRAGGDGGDLGRRGVAAGLDDAGSHGDHRGDAGSGGHDGTGSRDRGDAGSGGHDGTGSRDRGDAGSGGHDGTGSRHRGDTGPGRHDGDGTGAGPDGRGGTAVVRSGSGSRSRSGDGAGTAPLPWGARLTALLGVWRGPSRPYGPPDPPGTGDPARRPRRRTAALVAVVAVLALLALGVWVVLRLIGGGDGRAACRPPLELRVLTDPDLEPTVRAAADAYLTSDANTTDDGCRRSGITAYSSGSSDVVAALHKETGAWQEPRDEDTNPQRDIGPQPDVWIPASRADAARVMDGQDTDAVATLEPAGEPLAYSPVVLAAPQNIAGEALHERTNLPLTDMVAALAERDENAEVRRPDPEFTDVGLLATIGLHGEDARAAVRGERLVAQPGPPSPTAAELLCTLPDDDAVDDRTAALVPEFLMRSGVGCDRTTRSPRVAHYPEDVPGVEPLFVRVRWRGGHRDADARDAAVGAFHAWLAGEQGRAVFARDGFRSADDRELLDGKNIARGVLHAPSPLHQSAGQNAMERALAEYREAGGPGRVLFLLDSSGSMAGLWKGPSGGPGLLKQSLGGLGGRDEYGVWAVAGTAERPYGTLLRLGRHRHADAERAVDTGARVKDAEADPRAALLAAFDAMERRGADDRPQLIVHITDGEDNGRLAGDRLDAVLAAARESGVPVTAVSLENGGCDRDRPDRRIADASGGRCLDTGDDLGAALHDEVARTGTGEG